MKRIPGLYFAWLVAAVMLVFAVTGRHPYVFYTLLRWICCAVFVYSAFTARETNRVPWAWVFGVLLGYLIQSCLSICDETFGRS
jgi:Family of unknown function (DUF6804)